jgi:hypothetical protein
MPEGALDDLVKFTTVARFEPHRVIFSKGDKGDCLYGILSGHSTLEERGIRTCMGLFLSSSCFGCCRFFVRSGKAVLRPVAYDQVRGAMMNCDRGFLHSFRIWTVPGCLLRIRGELAIG